MNSTISFVESFESCADVCTQYSVQSTAKLSMTCDKDNYSFIESGWTADEGRAKDERINAVEYKGEPKYFIFGIILLIHLFVRHSIKISYGEIML